MAISQFNGFLKKIYFYEFNQCQYSIIRQNLNRFLSKREVEGLLKHFAAIVHADLPEFAIEYRDNGSSL